MIRILRTYRLKADDITYIFDFSEVDSIIVDQEYLPVLDEFKKSHPQVPFIVDLVSTWPTSYCACIPRIPANEFRTPM